MAKQINKSKIVASLKKEFKGKPMPKYWAENKEELIEKHKIPRNIMAQCVIEATTALRYEGQNLDGTKGEPVEKSAPKKKRGRPAKK